MEKLNFFDMAAYILQKLPLELGFIQKKAKILINLMRSGQKF